MKNKLLEYNKPDVTAVPVVISEKQPYSQPFWLKEPHEPGSYNIPDQTLIGRADILPEVTARFDFTLNSAPFSITEPLHYRGADPSRGEYVRPVVVEPPVSIDLPAGNFVFPSGAARDFSVQIRALTANQSGEVRHRDAAGLEGFTCYRAVSVEGDGGGARGAIPSDSSRRSVLRALQSDCEGGCRRVVERS